MFDTPVRSHAATILLAIVVLAGACGDPGARLVNSSGVSCADKVALAMNSSHAVSGAWNCLGISIKASYADVGRTGDQGLADNLNSAKYMETVKFVAHHGLYDDTFDKYRLLYRVEGHPNGEHVVGYTEIAMDVTLLTVQDTDTTYCKPQGDLLHCDQLPK